MTIEENIAASKAADEVWQLAEAEMATYSETMKQHFFDRIAQKLGLLIPTQPTERHPIRAMTNTEAADFGNVTFPFGKYKDKRVDDVPLDYLEWLDKQPDFRRELHRYLMSERLQREIDGDEPED